jgi:transcriptional regulator with XRE-family HTH domain
MAKKILKEKVLILRKRGMSYSQIRSKVNVSKSTLSLWLRDMPLSNKKIKELRDYSAKRIESYRNTMNKKREKRISDAYAVAKKTVGKITRRELFIGGIFLYMGEGSKTTKGTTALTNTNPNILKLFIQWLHLHNVIARKIKVQLHLYSNMDIQKQINYWSKELSIPKNQFRKPHIKENKTSDITYKRQFQQGTCTVLYEDVHLHNKTMMYLKYIQNL